MIADDNVGASVRDEIERSRTPGGRWHAEYLGHAYRLAVRRTLALAGRDRPAVLKTDLWNECLGGTRDILGHADACGSGRLVGIDISLAVCVAARVHVPGVLVVRADIAALPFRTGSFDAVLDLSTLDHLPAESAARAVGEYSRVLSRHGTLLLVFWQRNVSMRLRLRVKRWLGKREKADQHYLVRAEVERALGSDLLVVEEFVAGLLFFPPQSLTGRLLGRLPERTLGQFLRWLVRFERSAVLRRLVRHVAGLYGLTAVRRRDAA